MGQKGDENVDFKVKEAPPNRLATEPSVLLARSEANVKRKKKNLIILHMLRWKQELSRSRAVKKIQP